jgi:hypothetical protein
MANYKSNSVKPFQPLGNKVKSKILKPKTKKEKIFKYISNAYNLTKP